MRHYTMSMPRVAIGVAAAAMTVITLGVSVFVPATLTSGSAADCRYPAATVVAGASGTVEIGKQRGGGFGGPQLLTQDSSTPPSTRVQ
jgi:hypothetical protein